MILGIYQIFDIEMCGLDFLGVRLKIWGSRSKNPIENLWSPLKVVKPRVKEDLIKAIETYWTTVTQAMCRKFMGHLEKVLPAVLEEGGDQVIHVTRNRIQIWLVYNLSHTENTCTLRTEYGCLALGRRRLTSGSPFL